MNYRVNWMKHIQSNVVNVDTMERGCRDILCLRVTREGTGCFCLTSNGRKVDGALSWMLGDAGLHHCSGKNAEFPDYCHFGDRLDTIETNFIWGPRRHPRLKICTI